MSAGNTSGPGLPQTASADLISHLTQAISATLDLDDVLASVAESGLLLTGAEVGIFVPYAAPHPGAAPDAATVAPWTVAGPAASLVATWSPAECEAVVHLSRSCHDSYRCSTEHGNRDSHVLGEFRSLTAAPVVTATGERLGALVFLHSEPAMFDATSELFVRSVASHAAVAIANAQLYSAERQARELAESQVAAMAWLQRLTAQLARVTDWSGAVQSLRDCFEERYPVDRIQVHLDAPRRPRPERPMLLVGDEQVQQPRLPLTESSTRRSRPPAERTLSNRGQQRDHRRLGRETDQASGPDALSLTPGSVVRDTRFLSPAGFGADTERHRWDNVTWVDGNREVWTPFRTDKASGWLQVVFGPGNAAEIFPEALMLIVAGQLASTLERVRLFDSEAHARHALRSHIARLTETSLTLQRSLLPSVLPELSGINYATRYIPATRGQEVGGDWYDVIAHHDGSATFIIGDVEGHSISAAVIMGKLSTALHAYLLEGHPLDVALRRVNPLVEEAGVLATCTLVNLNPQGGIIQVVRAGHPLPLTSLTRPTPSQAGEEDEPGVWGPSQLLDVEGGPPLGLPGADWPVVHFYAPRGLRMLLYTDGLVERRTADVDHDLSEAFDEALFADLDEVLEDLMGTVGRGATDDVALIAVEMTSAPAPVRSEMSLASEADVSRARALTATTLDQWRLSELGDDAALIVSELCTNAVRYGGGSGSLTLTCINPEAPEGLIIEVEDSVPHEPRVGDAPEDALGGRGMLLVEAIASGWLVEPRGDGKVVRAFLRLPRT